MDLSPTHIHLLLNHFPTVGFIVGFGLFIVALVAKSEHLRVGSLVVLVGISLITIPAYTTGNAAEVRICAVAESGLPGACEEPGVSRSLIEQHEGAAFLAMMFMSFTGGLAWLGLWYQRRFKRIPAWNIAAVLILGLLTVATVSRAAAIGGEIRHPEIRMTQETEAPQFGRMVGGFVRDTPWVWIAAETLHFIGLTLLMGVVILINLKVFGRLRSISYRAVDRLLPWAILGFGINTVTGMAFYAAAGNVQYQANPAFYWKLGFLLLAGLNTLLFTFDNGWEHEDQPAPALSKVLAGGALFLWVGVMFWGSMLPFIGTAF
jgi:uncharacterized membrane protein